MSDGKGIRTFEYDETTGLLRNSRTPQAKNTLTFSAAYDVEGNMTSETYPNAMSANYIRNTAGETIDRIRKDRRLCENLSRNMVPRRRHSTRHGNGSSSRANWGADNHPLYDTTKQAG